MTDFHITKADIEFLDGQSGSEANSLRAEVERLRAENEALRKDAYRYHWIRDGGWMLIGEDRGNGPEWPDAIDVDHQVDAAIDAARQRTGESK